MAKEAIRFENFIYVYPGSKNYALNEVNVTIEENDFVGIIGCNKAGKSTLCLAMVGVLPHALGGSHAGSVYIRGEEMTEQLADTVASYVGIVFQDAESQFTQETVEDEIAFPLCNMGIEHDEMMERVREAATACHLMDMLDRSPSKLSGGQQQRLAVACILAMRPDVIILDESTSQLDPIGRDEVFTLVEELHKKGHTIIMVDHNMEMIAEYTNKVVVMYEGKVVMCDTPENVFSRKEELEGYGIRLPQVCDAAIQLKDTVAIGKLPINTEEGIDHFQKLAKEGK